MNFLVLQVTLLATVFSRGCHAINESSGRVDGFGYELLFEKLECLENSMKESVQMILSELLKSQQETKDLGGKAVRELKDFKGIFESISSCREKLSEKSGSYRMKLLNQAFDVYCEQNLYGGGWIVIQNRFDGSVDFNRDWNAYREGFGSLDGEFWIGLEKMFLITSSTGNYELMVHLEGFDGEVKYARYGKFQIGSQQEKYKLKLEEAKDSTAGDSLSSHSGSKFTTHDQDNDNAAGSNLAISYPSGWWCFANNAITANLNTKHENRTGEDTIHWYGFYQNSQGLKVSKMMIREV